MLYMLRSAAKRCEALRRVAKRCEEWRSVARKVHKLKQLPEVQVFWA